MENPNLTSERGFREISGSVTRVLRFQLRSVLEACEFVSVCFSCKTGWYIHLEFSPALCGNRVGTWIDVADHNLGEKREKQ